MSKRFHEYCEFCNEKITEDDKTLELKLGIARSTGFFRQLFGLINLGKPASYACFHVKCMKYTNYNYEHPTKSMESIINSLKIGESDQ